MYNNRKTKHQGYKPWPITPHAPFHADQLFFARFPLFISLAWAVFGSSAFHAGAAQAVATKASKAISLLQLPKKSVPLHGWIGMCPPLYRFGPSVGNSTPSLGGLRRGCASDTAVVPSSHPQPLLGGQLQLAVEFGTGLLSVDKVAEATSDTSLAAVQSTTGFSKICDGRELAVDGATGVPARVERVAGGLGAVFVLEPRIDVSDEVCKWDMLVTAALDKDTHALLTIVVVVAYDDLFNLAVLAHLAPKVFVKGVKVVLQLGRVHLALGVVCRVLVQVGQEDRLRVRGLDVLSRAAVSVSAGADFVVEGAVDFILLGSKNGSQVVCHDVNAPGGSCLID